METTLKLAGVLVPLVFVLAVLRFVHEALQPLLLPLLLVAAVAGAWWFFGRPGNSRGLPRGRSRGQSRDPEDND